MLLDATRTSLPQDLDALGIATAVTLHHRRLPLQALDQAGVPQKMHNLIRSCFEPEPKRRPAAADILKVLASSETGASCAVNHVTMQ
jgi:hypothetical protein